MFLFSPQAKSYVYDSDHAFLVTSADNSSLGVGYDFGAQNAFVSVAGETDVSNKPITARGTWFQKGNSIRAEADVKLDSRQKLWGT